MTKAWQTANPDLRLAGPNLGWRRAFGQASAAAIQDAGRIGAPVVMLTAGPAESRTAALCRAIPDCRAVPIAGARASLHLESDPWREPWFATVCGFVASKVDLARAVRASDGSPISYDLSETSDDIPHPTP